MVGVDNPFDNGQADAGPPEPAARGTVDLVEAIEDAGCFFRWEPDPFIGNDDENVVATLDHAQGDGAPVGAKFDSVADEVVQDLIDATFIANDHAF